MLSFLWLIIPSLQSTKGEGVRTLETLYIRSVSNRDREDVENVLHLMPCVLYSND
jgi:hypothetical protein